MNFIILIATILTANFSFAGERAVIQQMKGKRAIVQFEKDIPFSVGQRVYLNSEDGSELGMRKELRNPLERKNSVSLETSFTSTDTATATTEYEIAARYGWNMGKYEFGPVFSYSFTKNVSEISNYKVGGFFDFNFISNNPGEDFIWGVYGEGKIGNSKVSTASTSFTAVTGGAFVKWFIFSPALALRANALYEYEMDEKSTTTNNAAQKNFTTTGLQIGLNHYF